MPDPANLTERLLEQLARAVGPDGARAIASLRADAETQARVDELAERCNQGLLTADERDEYASLVAVASVIAVLQAKARAIELQ